MNRPATPRQLEILEVYARCGRYDAAAVELGIREVSVKKSLHRTRRAYRVPSSLQAYRAALIARDLLVPAADYHPCLCDVCRCPNGTSHWPICGECEAGRHRQ